MEVVGSVAVGLICFAVALTLLVAVRWAKRNKRRSCFYCMFGVIWVTTG